MGETLPVSSSAGERWRQERWPRFGFYALLVLVGWLLGVLPSWTVPLVVVLDAAWSARHGDWSLVAFLTFSAATVAVVTVGVSLPF